MNREDPTSFLGGFFHFRWLGPILGIALMVVASIRAAETVGATAANGLSLLLIFSGVVWALGGRYRLRRLAEIYLWLSFILAVSLLKVLTDDLARRLGADELLTFQVAGVIHVGIAILACWALGAWSPGPAEGGGPPFVARLAAGILIVGAVIFWVGARTFPGTALDEVSSNLGGHLWTAGNFAIATLVTLPGLGLLTLALVRAGDRVLSRMALATFLFGSVFWILHLAFRLTVMRAVAEQIALTAAPPPWYGPWNEWAGVLFGIFSVLAYISIVLYGAALLRTGLTPRWVGGLCIVIGLLRAPFFGPPLFIHVLFWVVALMILTRAAPHSS